MLQTLLQTALLEVEAGRPVTLVTIVRTIGSTPRGAGAALLAGTSGLLAGTIGGGLLEHHCVQLAAAAPAQPRRQTFHLNDQTAGGLGMACGGTAEVLFTPLDGHAPLQAALAACQAGQNGCLALPLDGSTPRLLLGDAPPDPAVFVLPLADAGRVLLIGGGHVPLALAALLHTLDFRTVVVDDRAAFCSPARFPHAQHTFVAPFSQLDTVLTGALAPTAADAFCIMTRGHEGDTDALRFALTTPASYIGVMGSRRKRVTMFARLAQEGATDAPQRVFSPIGLDIGGQTPAEIAVSVAAQLIAWRNARQHGAPFLPPVK